MKKIGVFLIILAVIYFIGGYALVIYGKLTQDNYNQTATIVGGIASIIGLLGLLLPSISTNDFKNIEVETLKNLAKTAEEIQKKEAELNLKQSDITKLELQKQELEFIVRKASLNLFYKEQLERNYDTFSKLIDENKEISKTIQNIKELEYKIEELNIEINKDPNTEYIFTIIAEARKNKTSKIVINDPFEAIAISLINIFKKK